MTILMLHKMALIGSQRRTFYDQTRINFPKHKEIPSKCVFKKQSKIYGEKRKEK